MLAVANTVELPPLRCAGDAEGLQLALRELFEESFAQQQVADVLAKIEDEEQRARVLADMPPRTLAHGYYDRAGYLLELGAAMEAGAQYSAALLTRTDVLGLLALRRAKAEFESDHPACSACGTRKDSRFAPSCNGCGVKFAGRSN